MRFQLPAISTLGSLLASLVLIFAAAAQGVTVSKTSNDAGNFAAVLVANPLAGKNPQLAAPVGKDFSPSATSPAVGGATAAASGVTLIAPDGSAQSAMNIGAYAVTGTIVPPSQPSSAAFSYVPGKFYGALMVQPAYGTPQVPGPNVIRCAPSQLSTAATFSAVAFRIFTADYSGLAQFAIYGNGNDGLPAGLIASTASAALSFSGPTRISLSKPVYGVTGYWYCFNTNSSRASFASINNTTSIAQITIGSLKPDNLLQLPTTGYMLSHLSAPSTFGNWPALLTGAPWTDQTSLQMPAIVVKIQSVP